MPAFDGTGPAGMGPMTGWGRGYCNPYITAQIPVPMAGSAYWGSGYGRGFGRGFGPARGRGFFRNFYPGPGRGRGFGRGVGWFRTFPVRGR